MAPETSPAPNTYKLDDLTFEALGDRLVIQEDEFRSGYECSTCGGSGKINCLNCGGAGTVNMKKCSHCVEGLVICPECQGKGGLLIVAEESQRRPTSGVIVSAGPKVVDLRLGQSVLYSNFAGYVIDLNRAGRPVTLRILHESEILCRLEGHLTLTNLKGKTEIALHNK